MWRPKRGKGTASECRLRSPTNCVGIPSRCDRHYWRPGQALRSGELTDNLVDTLVQTIERIDTTAQRRVEQELLADFRRVTGKPGLLFRVAEASVERPDGIVRDVFPRRRW